MGWGEDISHLLQRYSGGNQAPGSLPESAEQDFDQAARRMPAEDVSHGLSEAFRSDQTPPFGQMIGHLFNQSDGEQRAGMLNQLLGGVGPSVLNSILGGSALGGLMSRSEDAGQSMSITPQQAEQLTPEQVQEIAAHAESQNPGIIDKMSGFYAQHPTLVKSLGGMALSIALGKMAQRR